ncbi:MAG TPA: MgtC/SapB family protein [Candidatus Acidoferrales bacterium]|nr:MgtC/SapB family protein [Candidatus Acidoferrales bacterium]
MNWNQEIQDVGKLAVAFALALPVGWYREREAHSVGVRTFPIVAIASCGFILLCGGWGRPSMDAQSRVLQGIAAGIGFVGAGAILKSESHVRGTATAASIWNIAAMGAAVAFDHYLIAIFLASMNFITLRVLLPVKKAIDQNEEELPASPAKPNPDG